jgi:hypothetical protein
MDPIHYEQLPQDNGFLPAGKWLIKLRDHVNDAFAGAAFKDGISVEPIEGRLVKRFVTLMPVVGAYRVEGEPCALGDCTGLRPTSKAWLADGREIVLEEQIGEVIDPPPVESTDGVARGDGSGVASAHIDPLDSEAAELAQLEAEIAAEEAKAAAATARTEPAPASKPKGGKHR